MNTATRPAGPARGPATGGCHGERVSIRHVCASDQEPFASAARRSRRLHAPWVSPPCDARAFAAYLVRFEAPAHHGFVVCLQPSGELVGAVNLTNVVLGNFRSGYLGYFAFSGHEGRGYMRQGLQQVVRHAFSDLKLHRLEANIQPGNVRSIGLVRRCGFRKEGFSPGYLKIRGRWRDHERWAIVRPRRERNSG
jgi:ribosomal-protein-alanine N-acetyltransferase